MEETLRIKFAFGVEPSHRLFRLRLARYKALGEAVAAYIRERQAGKCALLDVGVGSGRSLRFIEEEGVADQIDFYGFDLSPDRLSSVYKAKRWRLFHGNIEEGTPFEAQSFDIVLCEQILEHLARPQAALNEISRLLRPDGLLVLGVPTFPWGFSHLRRLMVRVSARWFGVRRSHLQTFNSASIRRLVGAQNCLRITRLYGFRVVSGGMLSFLEDFRWWYRFNRWLGRVAPSLCTEVQVVARRNPVP